MILVSLIATTLLRADASGMNLDKAAQYAQEHTSQALVVAQNGKIVYEQYWGRGAADSPHMLASGSKTFVGLGAVAAAEDGLLKIDDMACKYLTEWKNDPVKSKITVRELLTMSSGIDAGKFLENGKGQPGWDELLKKPMEAKPNTLYHYGPVHMNLGAYVVERALHGESFEKYLERRILRPLGITVRWEMRYQDGHPQVAGGAFMTARDWLQLGEMLRQKGVYKGKRVLQERSVDALVQPSKTNANYGLTCWLVPDGEGVMKNTDTRALPDWMPKDFFMAAGMGKQRLYIIPSQGIVAVRFGAGLSRDYRDVGVLEPLLRR
ncbi:MAG: serine hydrolase [Armatimonadetes bacterium]|nr:serine hydrolase [Armatimonadota bacterium]